MEGKGELISVESKAVNELEGKLAEAYKTIAEKEEQVQKLLVLMEKITLLELRKQHVQSYYDINTKNRKRLRLLVPEVKASPILKRKAEEISPKECWHLIFQNLNADDFLNCRRVCKIFKQILQKEFQRNWKFHLTLPLVFPYLNERTRWDNVRSTCPSWRHLVDKYLSEVYEPQTFFPQSKELPLITRFRNLKNIKKFLKTFDESKNPFPSKTVYIKNEIVYEWQRPMIRSPGDSGSPGIEDTLANVTYIEMVGDLLDHFGRHIFKLDLSINSRVALQGPLTLCKLINRITIHLPNLKVFFINDKSSLEYNQQKLAAFFERNELAELPQLQTLEIKGLDKAIENYLLEKYAAQLTHFQRNNPKNSSKQVRMQRFKKLRTLSLHLLEPTVTLEVLGALKSQLKCLKLTREYHDYDTENELKLDTVLRNIMHLPIQHLKIKLGHQVDLSEAGLELKEYVNESIRTLRIFLPDYATISFNFLPALTKLERLELTFFEPLETFHPEEFPEVVELNEYLMEPERANIYRSNVWEKVPSLNILQVIRVKEKQSEYLYVRSTHTRQKYERFVRKTRADFKLTY